LDGEGRITLPVFALGSRTHKSRSHSAMHSFPTASLFQRVLDEWVEPIVDVDHVSR